MKVWAMPKEGSPSKTGRSNASGSAIDGKVYLYEEPTATSIGDKEGSKYGGPVFSNTNFKGIKRVEKIPEFDESVPVTTRVRFFINPSYLLLVDIDMYLF